MKWKVRIEGPNFTLVDPKEQNSFPNQKALFDAKDKAAYIDVAVRKGLRLAGRYYKAYVMGNLMKGQMINERSGRMRRAIKMRFKDGRTIEVGFATRPIHAKFVVEGVKHGWWIRTKKRAAYGSKGASLVQSKKSLRFERAGAVIYAKQVWHPGIKPHPVLEKGLLLAKKDMVDIVIKHVKHALEVRRGDQQEFYRALKVLGNDWKSWE